MKVTKFVKIGICVAVCAALIAATYRYVNKSKGGGAQGSGAPAARQGGGRAGPSGGAAPSGQQGSGRGGNGGAPEGRQDGGAAAGQQGGGRGGSGGTGGSSQGQNVTSVRTQVAQITALQDYVFTTGEIEPLSTVSVFPEIGGKVVNVYAALGGSVKKGDVLMRIDPSSPGMEYALNSVTAPIGGTVMTLPAKQGATVSVGTAVATIGDVSSLELSANVAERYVSSLRVGLKADITLEAYQDEVFKAHVVRLSPVVDSASRTKEVTFAFDRNDPRINAGMFAKVRLYTDVYDGAVVIPSAAVLERSGRQYVFVVNGDGQTVAEREVATGRSVDNVVQLLSGVSPGEKMVVEGMRSLGNGSAIRDITAGSAGAQ